MKVDDDFSEVQVVFGTLFDHRPFLFGEIINFKREFEEKRSDREVENLFKALEDTTEIKQVRFDKVVEASDANLPRTIADIEVALHMCEDTLRVEDRFNTQRSEFLIKKESERAKRLKNSIEEIEEKKKESEESYKVKEADIRQTYLKLEKEID